MTVSTTLVCLAFTVTTLQQPAPSARNVVAGTTEELTGLVSALGRLVGELKAADARTNSSGFERANERFDQGLLALNAAWSGKTLRATLRLERIFGSHAVFAWYSPEGGTPHEYQPRLAIGAPPTDGRDAASVFPDYPLFDPWLQALCGDVPRGQMFRGETLPITHAEARIREGESYKTLLGAGWAPIPAVVSHEMAQSLPIGQYVACTFRVVTIGKYYGDADGPPGSPDATYLLHPFEGHGLPGVKLYPGADPKGEQIFILCDWNAIGEGPTVASTTEKAITDWYAHAASEVALMKDGTQRRGGAFSGDRTLEVGIVASVLRHDLGSLRRLLDGPAWRQTFLCDEGRGWSAAHLAAWLGETDCLTAILSPSSNQIIDNIETSARMARSLWASTDGKVTPLHLAAANGHVDTVEYLIGWIRNKEPHLRDRPALREVMPPDGTDLLSVGDVQGLTALDYARILKHDAVARVLLRAGARGSIASDPGADASGRGEESSVETLPTNCREQVNAILLARYQLEVIQGGLAGASQDTRNADQHSLEQRIQALQEVILSRVKACGETNDGGHDVVREQLNCEFKGRFLEDIVELSLLSEVDTKCVRALMVVRPFAGRKIRFFNLWQLEEEVKREPFVLGELDKQPAYMIEAVVALAAERGHNLEASIIARCPLGNPGSLEEHNRRKLLSILARGTGNTATR